MPYQAPIRDLAFCLDHVVEADKLAATERFAEATADTRAAILDEAGKLASGVLAPLNRNGDLHPAKLENGVVRTSPGFADAYRQLAEGGWVGIAADPEHGGMGLPLTLATAMGEMFASANLALSLCPLLSQGQIEALEAHASPEMQALYLPKLTSGEWTGTMNLTEPQAGSDVGALTTKAERNDDGSYSITGQKIYISWGDHDVAENVCHLVLARLPDAPAGTRGLSLFLVPKFIPDADGNPGEANALRVVSLEHKMGIHGSPTAVMGYEGAKGWVVGPEGGGIACMFTMMNNARLGVGVEGLGIAEAAYQKALEFANERVQGRTADGSKTIIGHADVRRMLMRMKALTEVARAICLDTAVSLDMAKAAPKADAKAWFARGAFLTPIAKAFGTDAGMEVAELGIQVHGGMGFIEETGAAQFYRDVRVTAIYEGTNGVQAADLVGRKLADGGVAADGLLKEIRAVARAAAGDLAEMGGQLATGADALEAATQWMLAADASDRNAGSVDYLRAWALALGGAYLLKGAAAATGDDAARRTAIARYFFGRELPALDSLCEAAMDGAAPLYALSAEELAS
ncbi:acyl-CoA dehydrogenase [Albimonas sp. CAU 1670]|uniref:acyl-CoA dehydrogenase n=1 Tax=Albimonas sp. CAU 1670 TaxID=3032599 RepID=UPI0023DC0C01|nr:acyl-CoA dehydrogenase [Albimonas sp. CAU 1670]MDF2233338.1 acyl-CoA dehydrogenase [Albimonas sp. CAU 1670]